MLWCEQRLAWDHRRLVFLDETGLNTKMCRLHGRAPRGTRCLGSVPHGHWKTATLIAALVGTALGAAAGYLGGRTDAVVSRLVDVWMAFPPVLLAVVLVALLGTGLTSVIVAIAVVDWTRFARVVRAESQGQRALDYVTSARMLGLSPLRILVSEILPNVVPLLITLVTLEMGIAIVVEAVLSFVGLSVASGASTWGGMLGEGRLYVNQAPLLMALPIAATMLSVLGLNALGDGLRQELDPVVRA